MAAASGPCGSAAYCSSGSRNPYAWTLSRPSAVTSCCMATTTWMRSRVSPAFSCHTTGSTLTSPSKHGAIRVPIREMMRATRLKTCAAWNDEKERVSRQGRSPRWARSERPGRHGGGRGEGTLLLTWSLVSHVSAWRRKATRRSRAAAWKRSKGSSRKFQSSTSARRHAHAASRTAASASASSSSTSPYSSSRSAALLTFPTHSATSSSPCRLTIRPGPDLPRNSTASWLWRKPTRSKESCRSFSTRATALYRAALASSRPSTSAAPLQASPGHSAQAAWKAWTRCGPSTSGLASTSATCSVSADGRARSLCPPVSQAWWKASAAAAQSSSSSGESRRYLWTTRSSKATTLAALKNPCSTCAASRNQPSRALNAAPSRSLVGAER